MRAKRDAQLHGITKFKASVGWLARWRWHYGVGKSVHLHGEAGALRDKLAKGGYAADHVFNMDETGIFHVVFNMDETGIFHVAMPRRSYLLDGCDPRQAGRGTESLKAKEWVTLVLCLNATGSCKIEPLMRDSKKSILLSGFTPSHTLHPSEQCLAGQREVQA